MSVIKNGAPMGQSTGGIGPYNPAREKNKYFKAVQKDLTKRYGSNGTRKNPPYKKGNKIAT